MVKIVRTHKNSEVV